MIAVASVTLKVSSITASVITESAGRPPPAAISMRTGTAPIHDGGGVPSYDSVAALKCSHDGSGPPLSRVETIAPAPSRSSANRPCAAKYGSPARAPLIAASWESSDVFGSIRNSSVKPRLLEARTPSGRTRATGVNTIWSRASGAVASISNPDSATRRVAASNVSHSGSGRAPINEAATIPFLRSNKARLLS